MDWGPDDRLYGPRWFDNEVISLDVDTGEIRTEISDLKVPAAVKFNSLGELHVLDTAAGAILKRKDGVLEKIADLPTGLDNLAFSDRDELFVSSYTDGSILKVLDNGFETILPGGISHPGALAILNGELIVADIQSVRAFNLETGKESWVLRNVFRLSPIGSNTSINSVDELLILTSWLDNTLKVLEPKTGKILKTIDGLAIPVSATKFGELFAVALHGNHSVSLISPSGGDVRILSDDFDAPTHVINYKDDLLVSD